MSLCSEYEYINDIIHRFEPVDFTFSNRHSDCRDSIMLYSYGVLVLARLINAFGGFGYH